MYCRAEHEVGDHPHRLPVVDTFLGDTVDLSRRIWRQEQERNGGTKWEPRDGATFLRVESSIVRGDDRRSHEVLSIRGDVR